MPPLSLSPAAPKGKLAQVAAATITRPTPFCYLTFLLMRYCGRAACRKNRKRQLVYRCWKSYSTRAAAFLEKKDMVLMQTACDDSKCRNIHLH